MLSNWGRIVTLFCQLQLWMCLGFRGLVPGRWSEKLCLGVEGNTLGLCTICRNILGLKVDTCLGNIHTRVILDTFWRSSWMTNFNRGMLTWSQSSQVGNGKVLLLEQRYLPKGHFCRSNVNYLSRNTISGGQDLTNICSKKTAYLKVFSLPHGKKKKNWKGLTRTSNSMPCYKNIYSANSPAF